MANYTGRNLAFGVDYGFIWWIGRIIKTIAGYKPDGDEFAETFFLINKSYDTDRAAGADARRSGYTQRKSQ